MNVELQTTHLGLVINIADPVLFTYFFLVTYADRNKIANGWPRKINRYAGFVAIRN